jgi:hypothetical protein
MPRHFNVLIEAYEDTPAARLRSDFIWPALRATQRRNVRRLDHAQIHLWKLAYALLDGQALKDRPIAYQLRDWALSTPKSIRPNWRETFQLREFVIIIERWDN